ncbi:tellurium resistance protein TerD [Frondihabitans sp. PhB188]|uniref:TerD family protein n=1 Tax=Frondihabitans sp. PhB188 TaxID=2485200 RepID=UPI000F48E4DB|nr:TerD family protein [Frondihabitans sp. PhB188]ROQ40949.1 tellurium resistance protein TerD [Frondihabitans sp. PhB188]
MAGIVAGGNASLTAENPGLDQVLVGLGWDVIPSRGPQSEITPMALLVGSDGKALSNEHLVYFNQIQSQDASVAFIGGDDDEQIDVDLISVPATVSRIVFIVYVDPDVRGPGTFSAVRSAHIRVARPDGSELVRFDLNSIENRSINAMIFGELYRHRDEWKFRALGQGYTTGLKGVADDFAVTV